MLLAATVLVAFGAYRLMNAQTFQLLGREVARVKTADKLVALTFDDGPAAEYVDGVLADLDKYDARGTFFVIGAAAKDNRQALRKLVAAGEEIGNHSYTHPRLVFVSTGVVAREIESTDRVIRSAGYRGPILFRPPYSKRLVSAPYYLWRHDRTTVMWDLAPDSSARHRRRSAGHGLVCGGQRQARLHRAAARVVCVAHGVSRRAAADPRGAQRQGLSRGHGQRAAEGIVSVLSTRPLTSART